MPRNRENLCDQQIALYLAPGPASSSRPTFSTLDAAGKLRESGPGRDGPLALVHMKPASILPLRRIRRPPEDDHEATHVVPGTAIAGRASVFDHALPQRAGGAFDS